jgi:hypothetical protein
MDSNDQRSFSDLRAVKALAKGELAAIDGVEGFGIGDQTLRIYVRNPDVERKLPREFHGVPVEIVVSGDIISLRA